MTDEAADIVVMVEAAMTTAIVDPPAMMIVNVAHMVVVMTMALVALIVTHRVVAMIVTVDEAMTTVEAANTIAGMVGVLAMQLVTAMGLQEIRETHTAEVETKTTVLTIGTPVDDCGPLIYLDAERSAK